MDMGKKIESGTETTPIPFMDWGFEGFGSSVSGICGGSS